MLDWSIKRPVYCALAILSTITTSHPSSRQGYKNVLLKVMLPTKTLYILNAEVVLVTVWGVARLLLIQF